MVRHSGSENGEKAPKKLLSLRPAYAGRAGNADEGWKFAKKGLKCFSGLTTIW
jgi:hypothetical protein